MADAITIGEKSFQMTENSNNAYMKMQASALMAKLLFDEVDLEEGDVDIEREKLAKVDQFNAIFLAMLRTINEENKEEPTESWFGKAKALKSQILNA